MGRSAEGRNVAWLSGERVLQLLVGLVVGALVARHLGAHDYGRLAFALAFVAVLSPFLSAGDGLAVRDLESGAAPPESVLANTAVLVAGATLVGLAVLGSVSLLVPGFLPAGSGVLVLIVMAGPLLRPLAVVDYWFQARLDARRAALARNTSFLVGAGARVVAIALDAPVTAFAAIIAAEATLSSCLLLLAYGRAGGSLRAWRLDRPHLRGLWRQAVPLVLAGLSVALYSRIDQIMLGALSGVEQNGVYAIGVLLSEVTWFVPVTVLVTVAPGMTRLWVRDRDAFFARLQQLLTVAAAAGYAVVVLELAVGVWFIPLVYGKAFADTVSAFVVLTLATPFVFLGVIQTLWTLNEGRQGLALMRTAVAAVANVATNVVLLPRYGAIGAAETTLLAQVIGGVLANGLAGASRPVLAMQLRALGLKGLRDAVRDCAASLLEREPDELGTAR
jgi:PST family polysaccharide transporter